MSQRRPVQPAGYDPDDPFSFPPDPAPAAAAVPVNRHPASVPPSASASSAAPPRGAAIPSPAPSQPKRQPSKPAESDDSESDDDDESGSSDTESSDDEPAPKAKKPAAAAGPASTGSSGAAAAASKPKPKPKPAASAAPANPFSGVKLKTAHSTEDGAAVARAAAVRERKAGQPKPRKPKAQMTIEDHIEFLNVGNHFIKHGRAGEPHRKFVYVTPTLTLCWCEEGKEPLNHSVEEGKTLKMHSVSAVIKGKTTPPWHRETALIVPPELAFSVLGDSRTLDLEAESQELRDDWVESLQTVVAHVAKVRDDVMAEYAVHDD